MHVTRVLLAGDSENAFIYDIHLYIYTTYVHVRDALNNILREAIGRMIARARYRCALARVFSPRPFCPLRCGSRSRFSRTEANPRFRIPRCRISRRPSGPLSAPLSPFRDYLLPPETLSTQNYATLRSSNIFRNFLEITDNVTDDRGIATRMN